MFPEESESSEEAQGKCKKSASNGANNELVSTGLPGDSSFYFYVDGPENAYYYFDAPEEVN
jgi:hypothetical protein